MKVNIKNKDIELCYTCRLHIIYEEKQNQSADLTDKSMTNLMLLMYACILASAKKAKINISLTQEEFYDWLDNNGYLNLIGEFGNWLKAEIDRQYSLHSTDNDIVEDDDTKKMKD